MVTGGPCALNKETVTREYNLTRAPSKVWVKEKGLVHTEGGRRSKKTSWRRCCRKLILCEDQMKTKKRLYWGKGGHGLCKNEDDAALQAMKEGTDRSGPHEGSQSEDP